MRRMVRGSRGGPRRRAAAMVEFAIVLPLLLTVLFGIIEFGQLFKVRLSAQQAAREACRVAVLQSTQKPYTNSSGPVMQKIQQIMTAAGVSTFNSGMVTITEDTTADPTVTVSITVPYDDVKLTGFLHVITSDVSGSCSMRKEGV
jgi:Flp pilus assembly protein TadG